MSKYNADEESLFEPLEIVLEGKKHTINKITNKMMDEVMEIGKKKDDMNILLKQVAVFLGGKPEDYENIDIRKIGAVLRFITDSYTQQIGTKGKNA